MFDINAITSQEGRVAIVTGANVGLGFSTTHTLAKNGATVVMACRNADKANSAIAELKKNLPDADLVFMPLDLSDLKSVKRFAEQFLEQFDRLDLLINNAGVMVPPYQKTVDGFELQMGANYFGHFLLTSLLLPLLEKTGNARIVNLSSIAHRNGKIHFDDMHFEKRYSKMEAYGQSKLAMLMFSYELSRRLKEQGYSTIAVAAHPGVANTALSRYLPKPMIALLTPVAGLLLSSPEEGALPQIYAAVGEDIESGDYLGPNGFNEMRGKQPVKVKPRPHALDTEVSGRLWEVSLELTGAHYFD
ncbi:oxidoreductase [Reinekea blandensis]|uniref:Short chain dehydrogenase n=1 Tax=Reinekea blandensis MED297 TaxID=314283 RepID=A4BA05_9GAMM|nr:oxidoreductase [Reinekea blandensis]EAR11456.1 short chain dehydrogenase [Reinekea sp. MED297] [Reinekea blandensis MED297]